MVLDFQEAATRRMRRLVIALVALVVLLAGTVLALAFRSGDSTPAATSTPRTGQPTAGQQNPPAAPTTTFTPDAGFVAPTQWVRLPKSTSTRFGVPTGWEHTPQGAAAAAVTYAKASATWDYDTADRAAQAYAPPERGDSVRSDVRARLAQSRVTLGLPQEGPVPVGAHFTVAVIGVQWTTSDANTAQVAILARTSYTTGKAPETTEIRSVTSRMTWEAGDWRNEGGPTTTAPQPADIGSAAFNAAGWKAIQEGSAG